MVRLSLGQTLVVWCVQRTQLGMVGLLLREQSRDPRERRGKVRRKPGTVGDLAADVARDAAEKDLQPPDSHRARRICRAWA